MSSVGFSELLILFVIGLIVLGPERLPRVASQIGSWIGQARRMTRSMRRQLEDEVDFDPSTFRIDAPSLGIPRDDDTYSPLHDKPKSVAGGSVTVTPAEPASSAADEESPAETEESAADEPEALSAADETAPESTDDQPKPERSGAGTGT